MFVCKWTDVLSLCLFSFLLNIKTNLILIIMTINNCNDNHCRPYIKWHCNRASLYYEWQWVSVQKNLTILLNYIKYPLKQPWM